MLPKQTLQYTLTVPKRSPTLDFGCGVLIDDRPIDFKIAIADGSQEVTLHDKRIASVSKWHDARLDLSRWAGREVHLSLTVNGSVENVAFWSNPVVSSVPNKPFNVVIILEDALRADHLSTYGYKLPTSPFKDRFAKQHAIVFRSAISQAEKTRPSIPTIMTSLIPTTTGVWHSADRLAEEYLTLAEIVRSQGFITASFIQNGNAGPFAGLHQGFSVLLDEETAIPGLW